MKAAVLEGSGQPLTITDVDIASPKSGEVLVAIKATGVCHSDLTAQQGKMPLPCPVILGHEAAAIVEEVGPGVSTVAPGDHVVIAWNPRCGDCFFCRRGQPSLCDAPRPFGLMDDGTTRLSSNDAPVFHGFNTATFAERAVLRENALVRIPDDVPFDVAAVVGCAVLTGVGAAVNTAKVQAGDTVAVIGCGGVGINVIQGARLAGAERIIAIDSFASKLKMASQFGATHLIDATEKDPVTAVTAITEDRGVDHAFEAAGRGALQRSAIDMTRRGGQAVLVGLPALDDPLTLNGVWVSMGEKKILGCFGGSCDATRDIPQFIRLWQAGKLDFEGLVTQRVPLDGVNAAFEDMEQGKVIRTVLTP